MFFFSENSISSLPFPNSETDSLKSSGSGDSSHVTGRHTLQTFHPQLTNHDTLQNGDTDPENCASCVESCDRCDNYYTSNNIHGAVMHHPHLPKYHHGVPVSLPSIRKQCGRHHHGSQPSGCSLSDHEGEKGY